MFPHHCKYNSNNKHIESSVPKLNAVTSIKFFKLHHHHSKVFFFFFFFLNLRHIFLFDAAVIICKRRGDNYEMKDVIDLHLFKITNNPTSDKENRKVGARKYTADTFCTLEKKRNACRRRHSPQACKAPTTVDILINNRCARAIASGVA